MTEQILPPGFIVRHATWDDIEAVTELIRVTDIEDGGESDITQDDVESDWNRPSFDITKDVWLVTTLAKDPNTGAFCERVVGYEEIWNQPPIATIKGDGYVHPDYRDLGIGTTLLRLIEKRGRELIQQAEPEVRVALRLGVYGSDERSRKLMESEGYHLRRFFWRMEIQMENTPPEPVWPAGVRWTTLQPGQEKAVYEVAEEAFRDHWGHSHRTWEEWKSKMIETESFDPSLWFIAWDGDEIAGVNLCRVKPDFGWVHLLGVRRPWRRTGLGLALLQLSFGAFYQRGVTRVQLGVDSQNPTGATRLYQKAGMRVAHEFAVYDKELRPGIEPSNDE